MVLQGIGNNVKIGNGCKIQNNVSIYEGVELEDNVIAQQKKLQNPRDQIL